MIFNEDEDVISWNTWSLRDKQTLRRAIAQQPSIVNNVLTHEQIEAALVTAFPIMAKYSVEDDDFHLLITEIYAKYARNGAVDS